MNDIYLFTFEPPIEYLSRLKIVLDGEVFEVDFDFNLSHKQRLRCISKKIIIGLLRQYKNSNSSSYVFCRHIQGKPYIKDHYNWHFSVSYSDNAIAIVVSDYMVGIDVECVRGMNELVANRCYTKRERDYIYREEQGIDERFFEIWTKKEAYVKQTGEGLRCCLQSFDTLEKADYYVTLIENKFIITACSLKKNHQMSFKRIDTKDGVLCLDACL